jgi:hypothetical protein
MLTNGVAPATGKIASAGDLGHGREGPVGVLACADNPESSVFRVHDRTIPAPSAYVAGPAKVETTYGVRGFRSLRLHLRLRSSPGISCPIRLLASLHPEEGAIRSEVDAARRKEIGSTAVRADRDNIHRHDWRTRDPNELRRVSDYASWRLYTRVATFTPPDAGSGCLILTRSGRKPCSRPQSTALVLLFAPMRR